MQQNPAAAVLEQVASETGLPPAPDPYPALLRVGDNWERYPFSWDPFLALAQKVVLREGEGPVVLVSRDEPMEAARVEVRSDAVPFRVIHLSPTIPLPELVGAWIGALREVAEPPGPQGSFLERLGLEAQDAPEPVRSFLGVPATEDGNEAAATAMRYSATVRSLDDTWSGSPVQAVEIAREMQRKHPEYGGGRLGEVTLETPTDAPAHPWEQWRDSVARLYDPGALGRSRHEVLSGLLLLVGLALVEPELRAALIREKVWVPLLLEVDLEAAPPGSSIRLAIDSVQLEPGYTGDVARGEDHLGIQGDVNAVCEVITDPEVAPPLAVGLFGAWGSGKSFFMEKMRERIAVRGPQRRVGGHPQNVVQIRFNAWHYADTSLWASLAVEIFERLADPEPVDPDLREEWLRRRGDPARARREELIESLETYRDARSALALELSQLNNERKRLARSRREAEEERVQLAGTSLHQEVLAALRDDPVLKARLEALSEAAGVPVTLESARRLRARLDTLTGYAVEVWRRLTRPGLTVSFLAAAAVLAAASLAAGTLDRWGWVTSVTTALGSVTAVLVAAVRWVVPAVERANGILGTVRDALDTAEKAEARAHEQALRELDAELENAAQRIRETNQALTEVDRNIARTKAEARALSVGRSLYEFLADRATGYRKHQGVVGMLHRDFRLLDAQLRAQAATREEDEGLPRIHRVVLYVDDLDRCPPEKVLEVLEAVHLLLALPLFIVVVGVDPQWLQRSLRYQYRTLGDTGQPDDDAYLRAMPAEYLEKIFQIPLTLPGMQPEGYARLIASLAPGVEAAGETPRPEGPRRRPADRRGVGGEFVPTRTLLPVQLGSAADEVGDAALPLTPSEVRFAQRLGSLVSTPRAAKRLMNTYRLLRATQNFGSSSFLGSEKTPGECQVVLTLLAVAAGYPALSDRFFVALENDGLSESPEASWAGFVDSLRPGGKGRAAGSNVPDDLFADPEMARGSASAAEWTNMAEALGAATRDNPVTDIEVYRRWGRTVSRFSFTL